METPSSNGGPALDPGEETAPTWSPAPVQDRLAALWTELLGVKPRPSDDFFLLGGHSLLATQLTARVRETFGVELEMRAVFAARSLAALASVIEAAADDEPEFLSQEEALALV
jgi:acyl carrier protein